MRLSDHAIDLALAWASSVSIVAIGVLMANLTTLALIVWVGSLMDRKNSERVNR